MKWSSEGDGGGARATGTPSWYSNGEDPAYVMYTSGSTGTPKGVVVPHRAVGRLVFNNGYAEFRCRRSRRVCLESRVRLQVSSRCWAPLPDGRLRGRDRIERRCSTLHRFVRVTRQRHRRVVADHAGYSIGMRLCWETSLSRLRYLIIGGDVVDPAMLARVWREHRPRYFVNTYGPTETTLFATSYAVSDATARERSVPIGRPIGNTRFYVLDTHGEPRAARSRRGALHRRGGVARGYLNRPELTAERFVPDPFSSGGGRADVSDREIWRATCRTGTSSSSAATTTRSRSEAIGSSWGRSRRELREHAAVRDAVVLAREDTRRGQAAGGLRDDAQARRAADLVATLRQHVAEQLPEYMVPAAFVRLEALPLTPNGKLDRKALPAPDGDAVVQRAYEAPQGGVEETLAALWAELLGVERVGRQRQLLRARRPFAAGGAADGAAAPARPGKRRCARCSPRRRWRRWQRRWAAIAKWRCRPT